ncbi:MAG TPA: hypothetical protein VFZ76_02635, partial [Anaerolineales bacterium]
MSPFLVRRRNKASGVPGKVVRPAHDDAPAQLGGIGRIQPDALFGQPLELRQVPGPQAVGQPQVVPAREAVRLPGADRQRAGLAGTAGLQPAPGAGLQPPEVGSICLLCRAAQASADRVEGLAAFQAAHGAGVTQGVAGDGVGLQAGLVGVLL